MIGKSSGAQSAACCRIKQVRVFERQGSCKYKYKTANTKLKIRSWEYKRKINQKFSEFKALKAKWEDDIKKAGKHEAVYYEEIQALTR